MPVRPLTSSNEEGVSCCGHFSFILEHAPRPVPPVMNPFPQGGLRRWALAAVSIVRALWQLRRAQLLHSAELYNLEREKSYEKERKCT